MEASFRALSPARAASAARSWRFREDMVVAGLVGPPVPSKVMEEVDTMGGAKGVEEVAAAAAVAVGELSF